MLLVNTTYRFSITLGDLLLWLIFFVHLILGLSLLGFLGCDLLKCDCNFRWHILLETDSPSLWFVFKILLLIFFLFDVLRQFCWIPIEVEVGIEFMAGCSMTESIGEVNWWSWMYLRTESNHFFSFELRRNLRSRRHENGGLIFWT